jgi:ABC-type multidrug transport system fused ATPase/permease subunit
LALALFRFVDPSAGKIILDGIGTSSTQLTERYQLIIVDILIDITAIGLDDLVCIVRGNAGDS